MSFEAITFLSQLLGVLPNEAAGPATEGSKGGGEPLTGFATGVATNPQFQPYIFWAYGAACLLLFLFTLWTFAESKGLATRLAYLKGRFREAHPREADEALD